MCFTQYCNSEVCDDIVKCISEELKVKGKNYDIIEGCLKYKNEHLKLIKKKNVKKNMVIIEI